MTMHALPPRRLTDADHGIVFRDENAFCGWPFYCGLWRTADGSIAASFKRIPASYANPSEIHHDRLTVGLGKLVVIRSRDDGATWDGGNLLEVFDLTSKADAIAAAGPADYAGEAPVDFASPDTLIMSGAVPVLFGSESRAWMRLSADGGRSWRRPVLLPLCGFEALSGNGSAMVRADGRSLIFLNALGEGGWKRRPVVYASLDGGHAWTFFSVVTPKQDDGASEGHWAGESVRFAGHRWFYPRGIQLANGRILCALRCQRDPRGIMWTEIFESEDGGRTWRFLSRVNDWGAPGDIVEMADGRIACVYGYRLPPQGIRARVSEDGGRTWGPELVLRDDGGSWDLGYPRVIEQAPGRLLTIYYFNRKDDPVQLHGGVRHIARTIFTPD